MFRDEVAGEWRLPNPGTAEDEDEDEALADAVRAGYRIGSGVAVGVDDVPRLPLAAGEQLLEVRQVSIRCLPYEDGARFTGPLAVTTERLVLIGRPGVTIAAVGDVEDVTIHGGLLRVSLKEGSGFTIESSRPRLLRVHLAEARARRADRQVSTAFPDTSSDLPRR